MTSLVQVDREYGPFIPGQWVPAPRYLLRRQRILEIFTSHQPGCLLEIGCGSGALLSELTTKGFDCYGLETSPEARGVATKILDNEGRVQANPKPDWSEKFDYLIAMEVLEHIEDDVEALRQWLTWLKPGGVAIFSVPAHRLLWGPHDVWAGHVRRYSRDDFSDLARTCGMNDVKVESYGFPLANMTHVLRNFAVRKKVSGDDKNLQANTAKSGVDRSLDVKLFRYQASWWGRLIMSMAFSLQGTFRKTRLGEGFILCAIK